MRKRGDGRGITPLAPPSSIEFISDAGLPELYGSGKAIKLQEQPLRVLATLLACPGKLVSHEHLRSYIWPADTFVDFERGLHRAVNKLRIALGDSAANPIYIETIPRRGYRFVCPVEEVPEGSEAPLIAPEVATVYVSMPAMAQGTFATCAMAGNLIVDGQRYEIRFGGSMVPRHRQGHGYLD